MTRREAARVLTGALAATTVSAAAGQSWEAPQAAQLDSIEASGDLANRSIQNFDRLETPYYEPPQVFQSENAQRWPGDVEGRAVLALTLLSRTTHRNAIYLDKILQQYPSKMNDAGYFGPPLRLNAIDEQQLSGHGWVLRALCEHYEWKRDDYSLEMIDRIIRNLALPTRGKHSSYPIDPAKRQHGGGAVGDISGQIGDWKISTDIGCDFIFLDGVTHAYSVRASPELKALVEEMIARFLEADLPGIKAQTHASLTGMRALVRHYEQTGDVKLLRAAEHRYSLYRTHAMTENYANYNWFGRPSATEPCAIIDSFMLAVKLWQQTGHPSYIEDAHHIYFNGMERGQRNNGGYGTDTCAGASDPFIQVKHYEAYWCCTMRGGEGNARAIQDAYFSRPDELFVVFFWDSKATVAIGDETLTLRQTTTYPYAGSVTLDVIRSTAKHPISLQFAALPWMTSHRISVNGKAARIESSAGFVGIRRKIRAGDTIRVQFELQSGWRDTHNPHSIQGYRCFEAGPLLLGCETQPEIKLPPRATIVPDGDGRFRVDANGLVLSRINDLNQLPISKDDPCRRQVLFRV